MMTFKQFLADDKAKEQSIKTPEGSITWKWVSKQQLEDEEDEGYLPEGIDEVLELSAISVNEPNNGHGTELMKAFLASGDAQKAKLIYLDPNPNEGVNWGSGIPEEKQVAKLVRFYNRFGFRHNPTSATKRMWLTRGINIPDESLPT